MHKKYIYLFIYCYNYTQKFTIVKMICYDIDFDQ